ncbi:hypothetical protein C6A77_08270 [Pseudomonas sp. AFG_SD02_1510_Pfu_092]|nr:hypothetical protein C6A77_08270 [Pseudomonas sp. AFG_SD02_1510_Pfu_092]
MPEGAAPGQVAGGVPGGGTGSGRVPVLDLGWLLRGLARSHRDCAASEGCAVPVGAGLPAKRPAQAITKSAYTTITRFCPTATEPSHSLPSMAPISSMRPCHEPHHPRRTAKSAQHPQALRCLHRAQRCLAGHRRR